MSRDTIDIVSISTIANRCGVSRSAVKQWLHRDEGFPHPDWVVDGKQLWEWGVVEDWLYESGRERMVDG